MHYIQTNEPKQTLLNLRSSDSYVLALFRQLPPMVQQTMMRLLFVQTPLNYSFINNKDKKSQLWFRDGNEEMFAILKTSPMVELTPDGINLAPWFRQSFLQIISLGVSMKYVFPSNGPDIDVRVLQEKTEEKINKILKYMCEIDDSSISKGMKGLLIKGKYISYRYTYSIAPTMPP